MVDLNIPAIGKEKICSNCLRKLPVKYFLKDASRSDNLACNCNSCLFPNGKYYQAKFPELYEQDRFPKVDPETIPAIMGRRRGGERAKGNLIRTADKLGTVKAEIEKTNLDMEQLELVN